MSWEGETGTVRIEESEVVFEDDFTEEDFGKKLWEKWDRDRKYESFFLAENQLVSGGAYSFQGNQLVPGLHPMPQKLGGAKGFVLLRDDVFPGAMKHFSMEVDMTISDLEKDSEYARIRGGFSIGSKLVEQPSRDWSDAGLTFTIAAEGERTQAEVEL